MTPTEEICKNCEHQGQFQGAQNFTFLRQCIVWNQVMLEDNTCQHFQLAERLVIKREQIKVRFASRAEVEKAHDWVIKAYGQVLKKLADS